MSVLGFGNMGQAIVRGLIETGTLPPERIVVFDVDPGKADEAKGLGLGLAATPQDLASPCNVLLLAVKPQNMAEALDPLASVLDGDALVVSIMAGVSIASLQARLGESRRVARVMPNLPALVNASAAAIAMSANCSEADKEAAQAIFEAVGMAEFVQEDAMDTITALSGSGPAYFFYMAECMTRAAASLGLSESQAGRLAAQTLLGAGLLLRDSGEPAQTLRERVTSKGGTTAAALGRFQEKGFEEVIAA
ncbi:MAG: pyrroline-5-carboxylate reductase, partial [Candidatus Hydrogenedentes bacterium]|nr:pyrroline-5-carboxylate reductase [Candidatus Hydrogenedentota bacterium]